MTSNIVAFQNTSEIIDFVRNFPSTNKPV